MSLVRGEGSARPRRQAEEPGSRTTCWGRPQAREQPAQLEVALQSLLKVAVAKKAGLEREGWQQSPPLPAVIPKGIAQHAYVQVKSPSSPQPSTLHHCRHTKKSWLLTLPMLEDGWGSLRGVSFCARPFTLFLLMTAFKEIVTAGGRYAAVSVYHTGSGCPSFEKESK